MDELLKLLDKGFAVTFYNNASGTITGKLHSVSEIVIEQNDPADDWKGKQEQQSLLLEGEIIVEGKDLSEVIRRLREKGEA